MTVRRRAPSGPSVRDISRAIRRLSGPYVIKYVINRSDRVPQPRAPVTDRYPFPRLSVLGRVGFRLHVIQSSHDASKEGRTFLSSAKKRCPQSRYVVPAHERSSRRKSLAPIMLTLPSEAAWS
jgi:hypothetical protein